MSAESVMKTDRGYTDKKKVHIRDEQDFSQALNSLVGQTNVPVMTDGIEVAALRSDVLKTIPGAYRQHIRLIRSLPSVQTFDSLVEQAKEHPVTIPCMQRDSENQQYFLIDRDSCQDFRQWQVRCERSQTGDDDMKNDDIKDEEIIGDGDEEIKNIVTAAVDGSSHSKREDSIVVDSVNPTAVRRSVRKVKTTAYTTSVSNRYTNGLSLFNLGNTCFLNVLVQWLVHCPPMLQRVVEASSLNQEFGLIKEIAAASQIYCHLPTAVLCENTLDLSELFSLLTVRWGYELGQQQDVFELMGGLVNLHPSVCEPLEALTETEYRCCSCDYTKTLKEKTLSLILMLPEKPIISRVKRKAPPKTQPKSSRQKKLQQVEQLVRLIEEKDDYVDDDDDVTVMDDELDSSSSSRVAVDADGVVTPIDLTGPSSESMASDDVCNVVDSSKSMTDSNNNDNDATATTTTTTTTTKRPPPSISSLLLSSQEPHISDFIKCKTCNTYTIGTPSLTKLPQILVLTLNRCRRTADYLNSNKKNKLQKITDTVTGSLSLQQQNCEYYVGGVICHQGTSMQSGHYYIDINLHALRAVRANDCIIDPSIQTSHPNQFYLNQQSNPTIQKLLQQELLWNSSDHTRVDTENDKEYKQRITKLRKQCIDYVNITSRGLTIQDCHWVRCNDERVDFLDVDEILAGNNQKHTYIFWYYQKELLKSQQSSPVTDS